MSITFTSARTGRWSAPSTWKGGIVPPIGSDIVVENKHTVTLDLNVQLNTTRIKTGGTLTFDRLKTCKIESDGNITVNGRLTIKPAPTSTHSIIFKNIDESKLIGGDDHTDKGLWVHGGLLELVGTSKTSWTNLKSFAKKDDVTIILKTTPIGWKVNDTIVVTPTLPITDVNYLSGFDERVIISINKNIITLNQPLSFDHPINEDLTAEVLNLTRNVCIEGTGNGGKEPSENGRAHIHIHELTVKPIISNVQLRHMGPRRRPTVYTEKILGRYALHFHMCGDITTGTLIDNVVVRDCGNHCFVPHASHGITFKNCITYNTFEDPFWWDLPINNSTDPGNNSNNITFDKCIAAKILCDPPFRGYRLTGFLLGTGIGNVIRNCVTVGNQGNVNSSGFHWGEASNYMDNLWVFEDNIAHNNKADGIFVWQNDPNNHKINNFVAYNNGNIGIEHGAYTNGYKYSNIRLFGNKVGIVLHANTRGNVVLDYWYGMSFTNISSKDNLIITKHTLKGVGPVLFKECTFSEIIINEIASLQFAPGLFDFVNCNLLPDDFNIIRIEEGSLIRVQNIDGKVFQINDKGVISPIPTFFNYTI